MNVNASEAGSWRSTCTGGDGAVDRGVDLVRLQGRLAGLADQPCGQVSIGEAGDLDDLQGGGVEATDASDHRLRCGVGDGPGRGKPGRNQLFCE